MMRLRLILALVLAPLASPAMAAKPATEYAGADGGYLAYAVGDIALGMHFSFPYRRVALPDGAPVSDWKGEIAPRLGGAIYLKVKNPDFEGRETGHVVVRRLPPGEYLIENFAFYGSSPTGSAYAWSSAKPFAIRFRIEPGKATYIGSFMRAPSPGPGVVPGIGPAGFFVIADRSARDLPIARPRLPGACEVVSQVTNVDAFGSAILRSREPD
ncbi:MAG TPA: hypothetical protein PLO65_05345 [Caulobacter sp.]|nr:hypothetical protein [Caulobacter sp.]